MAGRHRTKIDDSNWHLFANYIWTQCKSPSTKLINLLNPTDDDPINTAVLAALEFEKIETFRFCPLAGVRTKAQPERGEPIIDLFELNKWCRRWISTSGWQAMQSAIRQQRLTLRRFYSGNTIRSTKLEATAHSALKSYCEGQGGCTLSEGILLLLTKAGKPRKTSFQK